MSKKNWKRKNLLHRKKKQERNNNFEKTWQHILLFSIKYLTEMEAIKIRLFLNKKK